MPKRILTGTATISGQPSGTSVKWKIETLNQGTGSSRNTRIHAASMGWK